MGYVWVPIYFSKKPISPYPHCCTMSKISMKPVLFPHYPLVIQRSCRKSPCLMGKSTINGHFPYQSLNPIKSHKTTILLGFSHGFPMFSQGFPMVFPSNPHGHGRLHHLWRSLRHWHRLLQWLSDSTQRRGRGLRRLRHLRSWQLRDYIYIYFYTCILSLSSSYAYIYAQMYNMIYIYIYILYILYIYIYYHMYTCICTMHNMICIVHRLTKQTNCPRRDRLYQQVYLYEVVLKK